MLTRLIINRREPFADGHQFGSVGPYEIIAGKVYGEVVPDSFGNSCIVNLANAPRNERGAVEYSCDVHILRPTDMERGNSRILYEPPNRGNKRALMFLNDAPECNDPVTLQHAGNGFLMRWGYVWATSGWQGDLIPRKDGMVLDVPVASRRGAPIERLVRTEICVTRSGIHSQRVSGHAHVLGYPAVELDDSKAELTVRMHSYGKRKVVPQKDWKFAVESNGELQNITPSPTHIHLPEGFIPGAIYELVYMAKDPLVLGLGFAAVRDLLSFLRYEEVDQFGNPNPLGGARSVETAYAWGRSQSGRFLRDFVYQGFNEDERGRQVFAAIAPHAAGGGRMYLNYEFARPVTSCQQHTNQLEPELFPFAYNTLKDPQTGCEDGILKRPATDPLVIHTQTSTEYWQKRGALAHTDGRGNDISIPEGVRVYLIASTQHNAPYGTQAKFGKTQHSSNPLTIGPTLRALVVAMDRWVTQGKLPPASQIPRLANNTAVTPETLTSQFPSLSGTTCTGLHNRQLFLDYGVEVRLGVIEPRPGEQAGGAGYMILVPAIDSDGNDVPGIRLPWVTVPLATYTGWNLQSHELAEGELAGLMGSSIPFSRTLADRHASDDPRLSLEERYKNVDDYLQKVRRAIASLIELGLMLTEDTDSLLADSQRAYLEAGGDV